MDLWQFTPLHEAASKNRVEVCSLLLSYGADPTLLNCHNKSTIDLAPTPQLKERLACEYRGHCIYILNVYPSFLPPNPIVLLHGQKANDLTLSHF